MKYIITIEAEISPDEIIGLKEQIAEHINNANIIEIVELIP